MYVGSTDSRVDPNQWIPTIKEGSVSMVRCDSSMSSLGQEGLVSHPALVKVFDEILVNAADNYQRDPKTTTTLSITLFPGSETSPPLISVANDGPTIPVVVHRDEGMYLQQMLFGHLLTGSNFDDKNTRSTIGGRHGYGAKLSNIFSDWFEVECNDTKNDLNYVQRWEDNMGTVNDHKITPCSEVRLVNPLTALLDTKKPYTRVTFQPSLQALRVDGDVIPFGDYMAMCRRVVEVAGTTGFKDVYLNGEKIDVGGFEGYCSLFGGQVPPVYQVINKRWEVAVAPCSEGGGQHSFVNNLTTPRGGTHLNHVTMQLAKAVQDSFKKKHPELPVPNLTLIKSNCKIFVNGRVENPSWDSQSKEYLTSNPRDYGSSLTIPQPKLNRLCSGELMEHLKRVVESNTNRKFKKQFEVVKRKAGVNVPKLDDAHWAGTDQGYKCTLVLTEGDSAKALAVAGLEVVGREEFGVFPLRGKVLNVRDTSKKVLSANAEVKNLCTIVGLDFSKEYTSEEEIRSLRYGRIMIMTDQDPDGSHIKGLVINFIRYFWPELLRAKPNFVGMFVTPLVKVFKGNEEISFGSMGEYKQWEESLQNGAKGWRVKYYKGLGTSTSKEGRQYFEDIDNHFKEFEWADGDGEWIDLAFDKKKQRERREWIKDTYDPNAVPEFGNTVSYKQFVDEELIHFSNADNVRSIPSVIDGFKPSQRKVLYACFKRNLKSEIKVAQLAGYIAEQTAYHHGEQSLHSTIVGMAQDYVGSNNVNLLYPSGQFGTRLTGGKDSASPRYIFTKLEKAARVLFHEADDELLKRQEDDGQAIEPINFVPIIPMLLVNGCQGIGTGWSTFIPPHNPKDIIDHLRHKLAVRLGQESEEPEALTPWLRGFKGVYEKRLDKQGNLTCVVTKGVLKLPKITPKQRGNVKLSITELPYGKWTGDYKEYLLAMRDRGDIKGFSENHTTSGVHFDVMMTANDVRSKSNRQLLELFRLESNLNLTNMNAFNNDDVIKKYESSGEILDEFFDVRLDMYGRRKEDLEKRMNFDTKMVHNKARFIELVTSGDIQLMSGELTKLQVIRQLIKLGFDKKADLDAILGGAKEEEGEEEGAVEGTETDDKAYDYLLNTPLSSLTLERIQNLVEERRKTEVALEVLQNTKPEEMWLNDLRAAEEVLETY